MKKSLILLLAIGLLLWDFPMRAGILVTNLLPLAPYSAGTVTNGSFNVPGTHSLNPHTFSVYHSATNAAFPSTNYAEITFDGGQTWATYAQFVTGTNAQTEQWTPATSSMTFSNRVRTVTTTNQTLFNQANWIQ